MARSLHHPDHMLQRRPGILLRLLLIRVMGRRRDDDDVDQAFD
jgi:hypothetical protein